MRAPVSPLPDPIQTDQRNDISERVGVVVVPLAYKFDEYGVVAERETDENQGEMREGSPVTQQVGNVRHGRRPGTRRPIGKTRIGAAGAGSGAGFRSCAGSGSGETVSAGRTEDAADQGPAPRG